MAKLRGSHVAAASPHDPGGGHPPRDRSAHDVRPGLRTHPRRPGDVDPADLHLRLSDLLPVPGDRLRSGHAVHGRACCSLGRGLRRWADAEARPMTRYGLGRLAWVAAALAAILFALTPVVIIIPIFLVAQQFGLLNTRLSLIVVYATFNVTIVVWMMESFFREIPVDLEEAAMVDGDTRFTAFRRIVLPLAAPGLVATGIFAVITTYNEFLFALVLTSTPAAETMPVGAATLIGRINVDWGAMSAAGVIGALPIVVFSIFVQKHLVRGLTMGAVK